MAVRPPHSAEEWSIWQDACIQTNRRHFLPQDIHIRSWPEGFPEGPSWLPLAEDHPFKGTEWCWRCVAEAQGVPDAEAVPHRRAKHVICWGPAEGNEATEHAEQDPGSSSESLPAGVRTVEGASVRATKLDASGRPVGAAEAFGSGLVRFEAEESDFADTGTLFWPPPGRTRPHAVPVHEPPWIIGPDGRHRYAEPPSPDAVRAVRRMAEGLGLPEEISSPDFRDSWPPSWTDDASAAEPVPADLAERAAQHDPQPLEAHPAEDEDRQPAADEEP